MATFCDGCVLRRNEGKTKFYIAEYKVSTSFIGCSLRMFLNRRSDVAHKFNLKKQKRQPPIYLFHDNNK